MKIFLGVLAVLFAISSIEDNTKVRSVATVVCFAICITAMVILSIS